MPPVPTARETVANGLYHRDIFLPPGAARDWANRPLRFTYSRHALQATADDQYNPAGDVRLPAGVTLDAEKVVEVQYEDGAPVKAVVRFPLDERRDLVMVLTQVDEHEKCFVKTVWLNLSNDRHATLDKSKYEHR